MTETPAKTTTFTFSVIPTGPENTLEQQECRTAINRLHAAKDKGLPEEEIRKAANEVRSRISRFTGAGHSNPQWAIENISGNAKYALYVAEPGQDRKLFEEALAHQERSAKVANNDFQRTRSLSNLCDFYRREGRLVEAISVGKAANELEAHNEGAIMNLTVAYYAAGMKKEANQILQKLLDATGLEGSVIGAHVRFENDLRNMTDLPVVQEMLKRLDENVG